MLFMAIINIATFVDVKIKVKRFKRINVFYYLCIGHTPMHIPNINKLWQTAR